MYCYKVKYWDGPTSHIEEGLIAASTPTRAMELLVDRFGYDEMEKVKIAQIDDESVDDNILPFSNFDCCYNTFIKEEIF